MSSRLFFAVAEPLRTVSSLLGTMSTSAAAHVPRRRLSSYDDAVRALSGLQTNAVTLEKARSERQKARHLAVPNTLRGIVASGIDSSQLDALPVIHVSGTKGKGSTCAFAEAILRRHGLKTGFFSSPHLVSVTERFRINERPIEQQVFAKYFWSVYEKVCSNPDLRPPYFQFLTILAFHIFCQEGVDVAIIEVGIGGEFDCTNVLRKPVICGITSLGLDHTSILGNTLEEIAWNKAGIMKPGVACIVDSEQPASAMDVIVKRAAEIGSSVHVAPRLDAYDWAGFPRMRLGLYGEVHRRNASIALQLCRGFLHRRASRPGGGLGAAFRLSEEEALGLRLCSWPGRGQTIRDALPGVTFFIDGAHTAESMVACTDWFRAVSCTASEEAVRLLVLTVTGDRQLSGILAPLRGLPLDGVVFCTTHTSRQDDEHVTDNTNFNSTFASQLRRCHELQQSWDAAESEASRSASTVIPYVSDVLAHITFTAAERKVHVLVTGSFHLVGAVLEIVQPDPCEKSRERRREEEEITKQYLEIANNPVLASSCDSANTELRIRNSP